MPKVYICPTITAFDQETYKKQIEKVENWSERIHIDLMDGIFAPTKSPDLNQIYWPRQITADIHLMYQKPDDQIETLIKLKPNLVIIHAESDVNHNIFTEQLHKNNIKSGLAMLKQTSLSDIVEYGHLYDHILIFSGHLGYHGGQADLQLLLKVSEVKEKYPLAELSWDGGINDQNAIQLVSSGIKVLNVGGYIQSSVSPKNAYAKLNLIVGDQIKPQ